MWRSRTSICTGSLGCAWLLALALALALGACRSRATAVAELETTTGTTERQDGSAPQVWKPAQRGTQYFIADAARVTNGRATLGIAGGAARIVMRDGATLRFTGDPGRLKIAVEAGEVDLSGTGNYTLDVGEDRRTVQIRSPDTGRSSVELTIDNSQVVRNGDTIELTVAGRPRIDAGVRDAAPPVDAAVDAPDAEPAVGVATIEITGRRAELLAPGQTAWKPLPPGAAQLAPGSTVRLGPATTARAVAGTAALELASGARLKLGDGGGFALEAGGARAAATAPATVELPGGAIALGTDESAAETRLDAGPRDTRVSVLRGGSKLTGQPGAELAMNRGETALLTRGGAIRAIEAIPRYFDFRVKAGESFTIHDPRPATAVQFQFDGKCPDGGIIELDRDPRFRAPKISGGRDFAHALITGGAWAYRLRCTRNGGEGAAVVSGRVSALRDDGRRPLPQAQGVNDIEADGRNYRISYQSAIPNVVVHIRNPGAANTLHLAAGGKELTFESPTPTITVPGSRLHEATYTYWLDRDGVKQSKVSTLTIDFDQTAPQVYIESPINGQPWPDDIDVRGAVLPGWAAAIDDTEIRTDGQRRFAAKVGTPTGKALAIRLSHPQRGIHYYLRRPQ